MIKNSNVYNFLKWFALICMPALVIAIPSIFDIWQIPYGEEIAKSLQIIAVLLGTLLGVSNVNYVNSVEPNNDGDGIEQ